jgi:hypothetical protein
MADGSTNDNPLDLSQYISGVTNQAYTNWGTQNDQMKWAKDQFAKNSATADAVSQRALDTSDQFKGYATRDQDLYAGSYIPAMKQQLDYAEQYTTPERMAANRAAAGATVANDAAAQRSASERALQSTGVDPSSGRFAGLDAGLAAATAAKSAAAMTTSDRTTEQLGQQYLAQAIQTGAVLPGQAVNEAGLGISAGNQAVNAPLAATASGAATMGTPLQWNAAGNDMYKQWASAAGAQASAGQTQQQIDLAREKQKQSESSGTGALIGAGMGVLGSVAGAYFGGPMGASLGGTLGSSLGKAAGGSSSGGADAIMGLGHADGGMTRRYYADGGVVGSEHEEEADEDMGLSPEERSLYERHLMNLSGPGGVDNPDGSRSTIYNTTTERDGRTYVIPTIYNGRAVHPDHAAELAEQQGLHNFPSYPSEREADDRYQRMHGYMERDTQDRMGRQQDEQLSGTGATYAEGGRISSMIDHFANGGDVPPDDEMMEGAPDDEGAEGEGNMVPPEASPSGGANVDDVHAMVSEGEFVMPKDVTGWLGEKFMQNLINKARTEMAGPKAEGQPGPPVQAMALSPPSFRSEGARAGA